MERLTALEKQRLRVSDTSNILTRTVSDVRLCLPANLWTLMTTSDNINKFRISIIKLDHAA